MEEGSQAQAQSAQRLECNRLSGPGAESARRCCGNQFDLFLSPFSGLGWKCLALPGAARFALAPGYLLPPAPQARCLIERDLSDAQCNDLAQTRNKKVRITERDVIHLSEPLIEIDDKTFLKLAST